MRFSIFISVFLSLFLSCSEDNTAKKKAAKSNQTINDDLENPKLEPGAPKADFCESISFSTNLKTEIEKSMTILFIETLLKGDGSLDIANTYKSLDLNIKMQNIEVIPEIGKNLAIAELNKVIGERSFIKSDAQQMEALRQLGGVWESTFCLMGQAGSQRFPYGSGKFVTVEFSPALPFAPFPEKAKELDSIIGSGITFENITGTITNIEGGSIEGYSVGQSFQGSVKVTKDNGSYRSDYNFGSSRNLEKLGLFNYAAYTFSNGELKAVDAEVDVLGGVDKVQIRFE